MKTTEAGHQTFVAPFSTANRSTYSENHSENIYRCSHNLFWNDILIAFFLLAVILRSNLKYTASEDW